MHLPAKLLSIFALAALPLAGCAEVTDACPSAAAVTVIVAPFPTLTGARLPDVELCETGTTNCVLTDENGEATLCLPFDVETSFTKRKERYGSSVRALLIPASEPELDLSVSMASDNRLAAQYDNVMSSPYPPIATGMIAINLSPALAGATFDLPAAAGEKLFYTDGDLDWSLDLPATVDHGLGGFVEVSPAVHQVEFGGTAQGCVSINGWPGRFPNSVRVPVLEGHQTNVTVACDPP
jgi:hypothetical protein